MVTIKKEGRADFVGGFLASTIKATIAKRTLSTITLCIVVFLLVYRPQSGLTGTIQKASPEPIVVNRAVPPKQQQIQQHNAITQSISKPSVATPMRMVVNQLQNQSSTRKSQQSSSQPESITRNAVQVVKHDDKASSSPPPSPPPAPPQPPPQAQIPSTPKQILQNELAIRLAQSVQPYTPSLAEIVAFKTDFILFCRAHNKPGYRFAPLVDKHAIKEWVHSVIPQLHIAQEYAHVDASNVTALTVELLETFPSQKFMLKAAHTSGCITSVSMQTNAVKCLKKPCLKGRQLPKANGKASVVTHLQRLCRKYLHTDYSIKYHEKQYANIPRRCVLEEQLDFSASSILYDYKIHTFHGRPMLIVIYGNRFGASKKKGEPSLTRNARTPYDWTEVPIAFDGNHSTPLSDEQLGPRPDFLDDLLRDTQTLVQHATQLVGGFPYVRADYFVYQRAAPITNKNGVADNNVNVDHGTDDTVTPKRSSVEVAFAELTFTHANCGPIFSRQHLWANQFYGFVGQHPEYNISPSCILDLLEVEKNNSKN